MHLSAVVPFEHRDNFLRAVADALPSYSEVGSSTIYRIAASTANRADAGTSRKRYEPMNSAAVLMLELFHPGHDPSPLLVFLLRTIIGRRIYLNGHFERD